MKANEASRDMKVTYQEQEAKIVFCLLNCVVIEVNGQGKAVGYHEITEKTLQNSE